jgi:hypothetical protein
MAKTVTIRNKNTGEIKQVPVDQLGKYKIGASVDMGDTNNAALQITQQRLQELSQNKIGTSQPQQPQGDFMNKLLRSRTLPIAGGIIGGGVGTLAGPVTGIAGAGGGAMAGDVVRKELAGLLGIDLGKGEGGIANQKGNLESVTKTTIKGGEAAASQAVGETLGMFLKFLKPGTASKFFDSLTKRFSKAAEGKILPQIIKTRFLNETFPKALESSGELVEQKILDTGEEILKKSLPLQPKFLKADELNFIRKQLNALGGGSMKKDLEKFLANDLARIIKEEQFKLAPLTKTSIPASRVLTKQIPNMFRQLPFGRFLLGTGAQGSSGLLGLLGSAVGGLGEKFSRFALPGLIQKGQEEE